MTMRSPKALPSIFLLFLLLLPLTSCKTEHELSSQSLHYLGFMPEQSLNQFATKLTWSRARQATLDAMAEKAYKIHKDTNEPMEVITDANIDETAPDERSKGRKRVMEMIGNIFVSDFLNAYLENIGDGARWIKAHKDEMEEMRIKCFVKYEEDTDYTECVVAFRDLEHVFGLGFDMHLSLKKSGAEDEDDNGLFIPGGGDYLIRVDIDVTCSDDAFGKKRGIQGEVIPYSFQRLVKKMNQVLGVVEPRVEVDKKPNTKEMVMDQSERQIFFTNHKGIMDKMEEESKLKEQQKKIENINKYKNQLKKSEHKVISTPGPTEEELELRRKKIEAEEQAEKERQEDEYFAHMKEMDLELDKLDEKRKELDKMQKKYKGNTNIEEDDEIFEQLDKLMGRVEDDDYNEDKNVRKQKEMNEMVDLVANMRNEL